MPSDKSPKNPIQNSARGIPFSASGETSKFDVGGAYESIGGLSSKSFYNRHEDFRKFVDGLKGNEKVLDLGAGLGSDFVRFLRTEHKLEHLFSVDLDKKNLKAQSKTLTSENRLVNADAMDLPFPANSMDIVISSFMIVENRINETEKRTEIKSEITRVLKPGGYFICTDAMYPYMGDYDLILEDAFWGRIYKRKTN